jgi:transcription-repair coupling factor (superfamily II helicase)
MDRLVCGDVGFGKTEIAVRAAFKAVADSKQAAILVPTTILAFQHFKLSKTSEGFSLQCRLYQPFQIGQGEERNTLKG